MGIKSYFDEEIRMAKLSALGDSLVQLDKAIDWEIFRPALNKVFKKEHKGAGGRPPYDYVILFKALVLQRVYNLSDEQTEFQINDRMSFMRFLGMGLEDRVPDAKTIWHFRNILTQSGVIRELFDLFGKQLEAAHLVTHEGTIVDATFVEAPKTKCTPDDRKDIKDGKIPEEWSKNKHKLCQKDTDARFTRKSNVTYFGYKDHVKADADSKLITDYEVTNASVHDSQVISDLIDETDKVLYADSAYWGEPVAMKLPKNVENRISERGTKVRALSEEQQANNKLKAKTRCRIEHIFGFMTNSMHGLFLRSIGKTRAEFNIGLTNLVYNMFRYEFLIRPKPAKG